MRLITHFFLLLSAVLLPVLGRNSFPAPAQMAGFPPSNPVPAEQPVVSRVQSASGPAVIYLPIIRAIGWPTVHVPHFDSSDVFKDHFGEMAIFWFGRVAWNDTYTDVRVGYNDTTLFIRTETFDRQLWIDTTDSIDNMAKWDSVSLVLDTSNKPGTSLSPSSYRFMAELGPETPDNYPLKAAYQGSGQSWIRKDIPFSASSLWRGAGYNSSTLEARGWTMDFQIPFASLGISGPPPSGTAWRLGATVYNRDDAAGTPLPVQSWPDTFADTHPTTWGALNFGLVSYTAPPVPQTGTVMIRNKLNGAVVVDGAVGGTIDPDGQGRHLCPRDSNFIWNQWGNYNFAGAATFNIQNQADVADWPCFAKYYIDIPLDQIPPGKIILSAKLRLYLFGGSDPTKAYHSLIQVMTVNQDWNEGSLTWNNAPLAFENVSQAWVNPALVDPGVPGNLYVWDLSWAVAQAYAAGKQMLRLAMYDADGAMDSGKYFYSCDDSYADARPTLAVDWGNR